MKRAGSRDCQNNLKLRGEFNLSHYWNLSYFYTETNNDDGAIKRILSTEPDVLAARRPTHFKLVLAVVSAETASRALWCVLSFYTKKSERGEIYRVRFRWLSEHAAAAEEPRAAAVTCLTCPGFSPPSPSPSLDPLCSLPFSLSSLPLSLARSISPSLHLQLGGDASDVFQLLLSFQYGVCACAESCTDIYTTPLRTSARTAEKNPEKKENQNNLN